MRDLPTGTVTFLFTDIEGSTLLLRELGRETYATALADHRRFVRQAIARHGGVEVDTQGDAFFCAFADASGAVNAAMQAQQALARLPVRVRMGIHTGVADVQAGGYVGEDVHLGARIAAAGHGGQVLLSKKIRDLVDGDVNDLGEHRLEDFPDPVWIFQLGAERFPPLKTISNTNLPRPASSFVGREVEIEEVLAKLRDGARLLTLTGPGGSGKTRLAIEAAAELVPEFRNGTFWVDLAALREPALVIATISQTLAAKDGLADHIGEREMLLLLDNLEQVIDAAPELAALVETCPNLRMVVTSRERLRVRGEVEFSVLPLAEPEAVELFCSRARLDPDEVIAELCRRLDGLPLAVELAAARTSVLSPSQILERLSNRLDLLKGGRDAEARQQTLRAAIEWSFELLNQKEQTLFARLSAFRGGCIFESAERVCNAEIDVLQSLVDKSLVAYSDDRFTMLETIREFAAERLELSGDEARELGNRHADHFLALAEEAEPHLRWEATTVQSSKWLDRLESEHDNLRAALDRFEASEQRDLALRLATAAWRFWSLRGHVVEGRRRLEAALAAANEIPPVIRANALNGLADLALDYGDHETARLRAEQALELYRSLGDAWGVADALLVLGLAHAFEDEWSQAQPCFEESVRLFREVGDEHQMLQATRRLAWSYEELGDIDHARELQEDMLRRARASGDEFIEAKALAVLAQYKLDEGRVDGVVPLLEAAHRIYRGRPNVPDRYWHAVLVCRFARVLALIGRAATAARLLACFEVAYEEIGEGSEVERWVARMNEETLNLIRGRLGEAAIADAWEQGRKLPVDQAVELALAELEGE